MLRFLRPNPIVCRQAVELVTDYLEDILPRRARARFEAHLADCPHCTEYLRQLRETIAAAGYIDPDAVDDDVVADLVTLYRSWRAT